MSIEPGRGTPFMYARSKDVLELLLNDDRIDVNAINEDGETKLSSTFDYNSKRYYGERYLEVIDCLLSSPRIDVNFSGGLFRQTTLLQRACENRFHEGAEAVLKVAKKRGIDVNQRDANGLSAAHFAFAYAPRHVDETLPFTVARLSPTIEVILKFTKELEIDLEATDDQGQTPLHYLARGESERLVEQFLEAAKNEYGIEFNVNAMDNNGKTPFAPVDE